MVQIPQYAPQVGLDAPSRDVPSVMQPTDGGIGSALSSLGSAITGVAEQAQARQRQKADFDAKVSYDTYTEKMGQALEEAARNAPADGTGLHDQLLTTRSEIAGQFLSSITDPELRAKYKTVLDSSDAEHWSNLGANEEWKIGNKYSTDQINTMWSKRGQGIATNPAAVKSYVTDMLATVDKAPNLTMAQREEIKQNIRKQGPKIAVDALKDADPEALYFATGHGTEEQRIGFLTKRAVAALPGVDSNRIKAAIEKNGGDVAGALGEIADENGVKEADKATFIENGLSALGTARLVSGRAGQHVSDAGGKSSAALISHYEGLRLTPYWDVNHWRVGYGSDTVTRADGTVVPVTKGMQISREDAIRDRDRRIAETQTKLSGQIGPAWDHLPDGAKAALTSVSYNYGTLPKSVVAAAQSGDPKAVSAAILGLSSDNSGVNSKRRTDEARIAAGGELPRGRIQLADASGTGGLSMNDAGPQYADGVPGGAAPAEGTNPRSGFVSPDLADLSAADFLSAQGTASTAYAKAAQTQLAQDTADQILSQAGQTADAPGDRTTAQKMVDAIGDAETRKDVQTLVDANFTRWTAIQKDQQEKAYADTRTTVQGLVASGDTAGAFAALKRSGVQPGSEQYNSLMTYISKGQVPFDDPKAQLEVQALKADPQAFAAVDLPTKYGNSLTADTLTKIMGEQQTVKKTLAGEGDAAARQSIETVTKANGIINDNLQAIGIPTSGSKVTPADIQHANVIRAMVTQELEAKQAASKTPLLLSDITETVDSVMKTYPRFKPVEGWFSTDTDVDMGEVLKSFDDAKMDPQLAAASLRKAGKPVNAATLQQALEGYLASKNGQ